MIGNSNGLKNERIYVNEVIIVVIFYFLFIYFFIFFYSKTKNKNKNKTKQNKTELNQTKPNKKLLATRKDWAERPCCYATPRTPAWARLAASTCLFRPLPPLSDCQVPTLLFWSLWFRLRKAWGLLSARVLPLFISYDNVGPRLDSSSMKAA